MSLPALSADADSAVQALSSDLSARVSHPDETTPGFVDRAFAALTELEERVTNMSDLSTAYQTIAFYLHMNSRPGAALAPAERAVSTARKIGDVGRLRRPLTISAIVLHEVGEYPLAMEQLNEAIDCAVQSGDLAGQCACWNQVGLILHSQGQAKEAIDAFEKVIEIADQDASLLPYRSGALANIGMVGLDLPSEAARGLRAIHAALALASEPRTAAELQNRVSMEVTAVRLLASVGEVASAKAHAKCATRFADQSHLDRATLLADVAMGVVEVAAQEFDSGVDRLRRAVETARHKVKSLHMPVLRTLISAYEASGQTEVAKVYLEELLRLNRESKEKKLLERHNHHLAFLLEGNGDDVQRELERQRDRLGSSTTNQSLRDMMKLLEEYAVAAELHDDITGRHNYRVGALSAILAREIGLDEHTCFLIDLAARLHDVGKLFVPEAILQKPGKLTDDERAIMQTHTTAGADFLVKTNLPMIHVAGEIARSHHERFDGRGYPHGLKGSAIPLSARITALSDVFDALRHVRPYKTAWSIPDSLEEIRRGRGTHFDPDLTDVFLELVPRLQREHGDLDEFLSAEAKNSKFIATREALAAKLRGSDPTLLALELRR